MAKPTAINNMEMIPIREIFGKSIKLIEEMNVKNVTL